MFTSALLFQVSGLAVTVFAGAGDFGHYCLEFNLHGRVKFEVVWGGSLGCLLLWHGGQLKQGICPVVPSRRAGALLVTALGSKATVKLVP